MLRNKAVITVVAFLFVLVVAYNVKFFLDKKASVPSGRNISTPGLTVPSGSVSSQAGSSAQVVPRDKGKWKRDPFQYKISYAHIPSSLPSQQAPDLVLKGIVSGPSGEFVAYIEIDGDRAMAMRKGDKLEGVEVVDITLREVVLRWKGKTIKLDSDAIRTIEKPGAGE